MASKFESNPVSEEFFNVVSKGSVAGLMKNIFDNRREVVAEMAKTLNNKEETPLLLAIKGQHFEMIQFLVDELKADIGQLGRFKWNGLDYLKVPPLFAAIVYDNSPNQDIINYLMDQDTAYESSVVLNSVKTSDIPQQQKIDILELVGAFYMLKKQDVSFAKKCWLDALALRTSTNEILQKPIQSSEWARKVLRNAREFTTREELEEIDLEFTGEAYRDEIDELCWQLDEHDSSVIYHLKTQALLIVERILSPIYPGPNAFLYRQLLYVFEQQLFAVVEISFIEVMLFILEELREVVISSEWPKKIVEKVLEYISFRFNAMLNWAADIFIPFSRLMKIFCFLSDFHSKCIQCSTVWFSKTATIITKCLLEGFEIMPLLNAEETEEFKQWLTQFVNDNNSRFGVRTLLHEACQSPVRLNFRFGVSGRRQSRMKFVQLLLDAGSDPSAADERGWSPLHYLFDCNYYEEISTGVQLLLKAGAHMDQLNDDGRTPLDYCKALQVKLNKEGRPNPHLDAFVNSFFPLSLQCFCAQVIVRKKIAFKDALPSDLRNFVVRHGGKM